MSDLTGNAYYEKQWEDLREKMKNPKYKQHTEWSEEYSKKLFKPPKECMNTDKGENKYMREKIKK